MKQTTKPRRLPVPTSDQVAARAYELFLQRGQQHGHDMDDWLQAEYELMQLPVRKIAELAPPPPRTRSANHSALVSAVHAAMILGGAAATQSAPW